MNSFRRVSLLLVPLCAVAALHAQTKPTSKPSDADLAQEVTGSPDTEAARLQVLRDDLERAKKELEQLEQIEENGGMVAMVRRKLGLRQHETRSFQPKTRMTGVKRPVRTMTAKELEAAAPNTMFTVNEQPVSTEEYAAVYNFQKLTSDSKNGDLFKRRAIEALALRSACIAENPTAASTNRRRLEHAKIQIVDEERPFAELAREISEDKYTKDKGGKLGKVRANDQDVLLMSRVFDLEEGDMAILESSRGYHLVECIETLPDARDIRHIFLPYCPEVDFVHKAVKGGLAEFVFRSGKDIHFAPGVEPKGVSSKAQQERLEKKQAEFKRQREQAERNRKRGKGDKQPKKNKQAGKQSDKD